MKKKRVERTAKPPPVLPPGMWSTLKDLASDAQRRQISQRDMMRLFLLAWRKVRAEADVKIVSNPGLLHSEGFEPWPEGPGVLNPGHPDFDE